MASADTRSGFRLPWTSDRSQDDSNRTETAEAAIESAAETTRIDEPAWPESDIAARIGVAPTAQRPFEPAPQADAEPVTQEPAAGPRSEDQAPVEPIAAPAPVMTRKPTKLMADLAAAILATTEAARDRALTTLDVEATQVVESIRAASTEGAAAIRRKSDEDLAGIRDWSKAEIARIREETEGRIETRKASLQSELAAHAAAVEGRVGEVEGAVARFRADMTQYFDGLAAEEDPARLATLAEAMPEPPSLDAWTDLASLDLTAGTTEPIEAAAEAALEAPVEAVETVGAIVATETTDGTDAEADAEAAAATEAEAESAWVTPDDAWAELTGEHQTTAHQPIEQEPTDQADGDDVPRWVAGDAPEGFPEDVESGDPVDRGAIMAALEAAAEAVVAAESAAVSADQAEAAADVAETAAELVVGRHDAEADEAEAQAALSARVDAGGFETESFAGRLASLLPGHADGAADGEPRTTQVVVTGLVSVASIASFKRHLARLPGVLSVGVASGPDGEFVFNVNHRPDVSFRDVIPSMPGFAARVVATDEGVVTVTARDPEAEG